MSPPSTTELPADASPSSAAPEVVVSSSLLERADPLESELLSVSFNQDYGCFACATNKGFFIYNCDPFTKTFQRDFKDGGVGMVEMLFRCNILALVGGGVNPIYPPNKVMLWDDHQNRCVGELSFRSEVRAVRLRRDRIVVILEHKIYVYNFADLKLLHQIETIANPQGICALSAASNSIVLACLGLHRGQVRVEHYSLKKTKFIQAHDSKLACVTLTLDGKLLATASSKGTLVRIFDTVDGTRLREVRRGAHTAEIYSIAFSPDAQWLALSSDTGTVHVFALKDPTAAMLSNQSKHTISVSPSKLGFNNGSKSGRNSPAASGQGILSSGYSGSNLSFIKGVLPKYFSSEWSFAQFRLPEDVKTLVAFGSDKTTILIVGMDGSFYRCSFDPAHGGEMQQIEFVRFMGLEDEVMI
ncbi:hypothetical protein KP509_14G026400 [Ceratopteris richardii]|uniref:Autophagy-related protein 18a n=1 Tax=Ceratopteris richardii TaxID=49495 RepID=A0A8T2TAC5_CERRI|nr:hypothetical protein KP509_14G026400 [Ceratopteris richardii]KAH7415081.1 hypothetical protein KP509_14G026400 [Ceratopteris richardii]KAH7415082.1 hypothetical protein KP509_14G026400 [Ceratopteris richardii]